MYDLRYLTCRPPADRIKRFRNGASWLASPLAPRSPSVALIIGGQLVKLGRITVTLPSSEPYSSPRVPIQVQRRLRLGQLRNRAPSTSLGGISGIVTDRAGHGLADICYSVQFKGSSFGAVTGLDGRFNTGKNIPAGRYTVEFAASCDLFTKPVGNWAPEWYRAQYSQAAADPVVVRAGKITKGINAAMRPGGVITGTVTGPTGHGVARVCVVVIAPDGTEVAQPTTPRSGRYRVEALDPGRYRLGFFPGCGSLSQYLPQWWPGRTSEAGSGRISVRFGQRRTHVDVRLVVGGKITGVVRFLNRHGRPLTGICVSASPTAQQFSQSYDTSTGAGGKYELIGLPTGRYLLSFSTGCNNNGNYLYLNYPHAVRVRTGHVVTGVNAYLQPGAIVTGSVTDATTGHPLAGICAYDDNGESGVTGANGSYVITQITPAVSTIGFSNCQNSGSFAPQYYNNQVNQAAAEALTLTGGRTTSGIDAKMQPGAVIRGTVRLSSGHKLGGTCADAVPTDNVRYYGPQFAIFSGFEAQSSGGKFAIKDLPAGQYQLAFRYCGVGADVAQRWFMQRRGYATGDRINVPAGGLVSGISAILHRGGMISGWIYGPAGQPQSFVCVTVNYGRSQVAATDQFPLATGEGYGLPGLAPGLYTVEFSACGGQNLALQWYPRASSPASAREVRVAGGRNAGSVNAWMTVGGAITGRVISRATGKPLANACVFAAGISHPFFGFGSSDRSGRYRVIGLNTGTYRLTFSSCFGTDLITQVSGRRVTVTAGHSTAGPDAAMTAYQGGAIAGQVLGGSPVPGPEPGVCVDAIPASPASRGAFEGFGSADASGVYKISNLVPGRYLIYFGDQVCPTDPGNLAPQWYPGTASKSAATAVTVTGGHTVGAVGAKLLPDGGISGTVTGPAPATTPLRSICVQGIPLEGGAPPLITTSAANGTYRLAGLTPGRYRVEFTSDCGPTGYATQWWHHAPSVKTASSVLVLAGNTTTGIDAAMK